MTRVVFDQQQLAQLLTDEPIAADLKRRGLQVQRVVKRSLKQAGTGRAYKRGSVIHIASAPGQPPATDTGRLAASITEQLSRDDYGLVERIGSNVEYALPLEIGTRFMEARPYLRRGLEAAADQGGTS